MCEPNLIVKCQPIWKKIRRRPVASIQNCLKYFIDILLKLLTASLLLAKKQRNNGITSLETNSSCNGRNIFFQPHGQQNPWKKWLLAIKMQNRYQSPISAFPPRSHRSSQAATSQSHESSEWARAAAYWEKTTTHSREPSSSLCNTISLTKSKCILEI